MNGAATRGACYAIVRTLDPGLEPALRQRTAAMGVAVARELAGFVWAIGCEVQASGWQGVTTEPADAVAH